MVPPFPCSPVSRQCLWKKTLIEKKKMTSQKIFNSTSYDHDLLIKTQISAVKNNVSLSIHYLMIATLFGHAVPDYTCKMFCFHRYDLHDLQICVNLTKGTLIVSRKKKGCKVCTVSWNNNVWMFDILNEPGSIHQFSW